MEAVPRPRAARRRDGRPRCPTRGSTRRSTRSSRRASAATGRATSSPNSPTPPSRRTSLHGPQGPRGQRHHAPVPDQRRGAPRRRRRDRVRLPARHLRARVHRRLAGPSADDDARIKWVRDYYEATAPHSEPGGYINFMARRRPGPDPGQLPPATTRGSSTSSASTTRTTSSTSTRTSSRRSRAANVGRRLSGCRRRRDDVRTPSVVTLEILLPGVDKSKSIGDPGGSAVSRQT